MLLTSHILMRHFVKAIKVIKILRGLSNPQTLDYQTNNQAFVVKKGRNTEGVSKPHHWAISLIIRHL